MLDWIDQRLQVTPRTGMLDMKYFAQYSPKISFKFVVDCVHNVPIANAHVEKYMKADLGHLGPSCGVLALVPLHDYKPNGRR